MGLRHKKISFISNALLLTFSLAAADVRTPEPAEASRTQAQKRGVSSTGSKTASPAFRNADALGKKLAEWKAYNGTKTGASFYAIRAFIDNNPDWPGQARMALAAEKAMPGSLPDNETISWFRRFPPRTGDGMTQFMNALLAAGPRAEAADALNAWWPDAPLNGGEQAQILSRYGDMIARDAHIARLNNVMAKRQYASARALASRLKDGYPQMIEARIALSGRHKGADALISKVPAHLQNDAGLLYERLRWRRRAGNMAGAVEILARMPQGASLYNAGDWWAERHIVARELVKDKQYSRAYQVASAHGLSEGIGFAEGEFLSGWLALRFLRQPENALRHFEALYEGTSTPISRARGAFWAGLACEALNRHDAAQNWYNLAAAYATTFYGQRAEEKLPPGQKPAPDAAVPATPAERDRFEKRELARAARLLASAGMKQEALAFLDSLAASARTAQDYQLTAELAASLGQQPRAIKYAKDALNKGFLIPDHLHPVTIAETGRHRSMVYAVIRQESAFDPRAVSSAGARGLMQLMPPTAKETARRIGVSYNQQRLFDPAYNIRLGSSTLERLLHHYGYDAEDETAAKALALAAYNGGMGNVARWIAANGDPRQAHIDLLDWIELIPFPETRNYVQRVLESERVYRQKSEIQLAYTHQNAPKAAPDRPKPGK